MSLSTAFEAHLCFHAVALINREAERKKLNIFRNSMFYTVEGMVVQFVRKAWDALTNSRSFGSLQVLIQ